METEVNKKEELVEWITVPTEMDYEYMKIADLVVAQKSKDPASKVGAVLLTQDGQTVTGYNKFPEGCKNTPERWERPLKYDWVNHAEPTVICNAARMGICTNNSSVWLNWYPCKDCAGYMVEAGVKRLFVDQEPEWEHHKWGHDFKVARDKLAEGGVEVIIMNYDAHRQGNI